MKTKFKDAALVQYTLMFGAKLLGYDKSDNSYTVESEKTRREWRQAYEATEFPDFTKGVSHLIQMKNEV